MLGIKKITTTLKNQDLKVATAKAELIKVSKHFYSKGWMMGTSGNLSVLINEPIEFLITTSGKDKGELTEKDFLLVNENGEPVQETNQKPSAETLLHSAIYKNTEAKAVYHVHTTNVTLLSQLAANNSQLIFSNLEMLKGLGFKTHDVTVKIPIIDNSQDMKYIASIAPNYIDENIPGLILRGHGIYAWGKTPEEAKRHIEIFEFLFEYRVKELSMKSN